jgi:hypothetical protein
MILLCGIPSETPLELVRNRLDERSVPYVLFNQRRFADISLEFSIDDGAVTGTLRTGGETHPLEAFAGVYTRVMDYGRLPEVRNTGAHGLALQHCRLLHETLMRWIEVTPAQVVNRSGPQASNFSKPYQAQLIRMAGFLIPETLITNEPELALEFVRKHRRVVYKSISGVRSIVRTVEGDDLKRLDRIRWCPVQFQQYIGGANVRVHVVDDETFATAIATGATDYRYAHQEDGTAVLQPIELSDELQSRCTSLARQLQLPVAGIDLKVTPEGEAYCLEVNPSPAFSYYELETKQPISDAIARYLEAA